MSLQLAPDTTNIVCVIGASTVERYWKATFQSDCAQFTNRLSFTWLNDLSFDQMLERVQKLPPHSFIFFLLLIRDAAGVTHNGDEALSRICKVANAPVNSDFRTSARDGNRWADGFTGPSSREPNRRDWRFGFCMGKRPQIFRRKSCWSPWDRRYDWRDLHRWQISEEHLPRGSIVKYRRLTLWERHKYLIIAGLSVVFVQSVLIAGLVVNLNRRRKAERSLRESEQRFRTMADSAPVLIWMSGPDKKCVFFNRSWLDFTGRTMQQELGDGWAESVHPEHLEHCLQIYHTAFDTRSPFEMEYRLRRHDGEYRWVMDRGVPRYAPNQDFLGYVGMAIDLTDRKSAEEARQRLVHTSRLAVVGELSAMIVHELNQPLTAIRFNVETAKTLVDPQSAAGRELVEVLTDIQADEEISALRTPSNAFAPW